MDVTFSFNNTYSRLPDRFFARVDPTPVSNPSLIAVNHELAELLQLDFHWLASREGVDVLAGNRVPEGAEPIAAAYAGHQFGHPVPQLGDGRAVLIGETVDRDGVRRDIQLKGSGRTPFSRGGDGRAALGPVIREYLVSEAMAALGIPTTRALAAVATGDSVIREQSLPGAVLTRVASSHIRVGTFQYFAFRRDVDGVRALADYVIARHYPSAAEAESPYRVLLDAVVARQADLVAKWLLVGFIHGVMNTDNMSISGETIDYGPCAFLDAYDPATVFSAIDQLGRYAYGNQPRVAQWNLTRLAEALVPLLAEDTEVAIAAAQEVLAAFAPRFEAAFHAGLRRKLGLSSEREGDVALGQDLLDLMRDNQADYTLTFRHLGTAASDPTGDEGVRNLFVDPTAYDRWSQRWRKRLAEDPDTVAERRAAMDLINPKFIPRNHQIEAVIEAAVERGDLSPFAELRTVLSSPYDEQPQFEGYAAPPSEQQRVLQTFCGT
ncbi:protein adenylyltransferase SelO [Methylobacterium sp. 17Sr1-1]|uniref:protein adenylyltransferase SelO n=1 Tax=Methylobacterium sp. 17Sr1-1 TaxID=2202826 RepID=UPI000D6FAE12|nr:YdiU family protein [Methylobacterium sp. 17Sr1-1]AWN51066.1 YdiU family protein [Methylobacterium sp. 17Sr1-1]